MTHHIPLDMQSEIMKKLPVKSLIRFRSVSKQWKSFIHNPNFIKNYHVNHKNTQHHLILRYKLDDNQTYTSIIENETFPQQKSPLTAPESLSLLNYTSTLSSVNGLLCFCGFYDSLNWKKRMVVVWNPTIRKSVGIVVIHKVAYKSCTIGFGVCPVTSDIKLVKITVIGEPSMWEVDVYNLSTRLWKTVYTGDPFKSCDLTSNQIFVDGVIYFSGYDFSGVVIGGVDLVRSHFIISFDLKGDKFGEVGLPERLALTHNHLKVAKVNELLGLLEYYDEGKTSVCGVWTRKDGDNKPFNNIFTVKVEGKWLYDRVLGSRNNGKVVIELDDDNNYDESRIEVYEPLSGHANGIGINGAKGEFSAWSYMETLLLLDQSDSIIR